MKDQKWLEIQEAIASYKANGGKVTKGKCRKPRIFQRIHARPAKRWYSPNKGWMNDAGITKEYQRDTRVLAGK